MKYKLSDLTVDGKGTYGIAASAVDYDSQKPTYLRITDINDDGTINFDGLKSVDDENSYKYILKENDIVFARTGASTGRSYFYQKEDGVFVYAGFLIKFSLDPQKVNPRYLKYYTHSKIYYDWVHSFDSGATRGNINAKTFGDMLLDLPERNVQDEIVSILKDIDDKIAVNRRICENLEAQAQALFKHWFVDFAPFKDGKFVVSELGLIPEGWRVFELQELVTIKRGGSPRPIQDYLSEKGYRWLKISDATCTASPFVFEIKEKIKESGVSKTVHLEEGSLVLSNSATPGIPKIMGVDTCIHDGWLYFPQSRLSNYFLFLLFKNKYKYILSQGNGSVFTNLKTDILKALKIVLPPKNIMEKFDRIVESLFNAIEVNTLESLRLSSLRDTLLPKLMSGQIKV